MHIIQSKVKEMLIFYLPCVVNTWIRSVVAVPSSLLVQTIEAEETRGMKLVIGYILVLLWMGSIATAEDTLNDFLKDIIETFSLTSPTIVYNGDVDGPGICYSEQWVSCVHSGLMSFHPDEGLCNFSWP